MYFTSSPVSSPAGSIYSTLSVMSTSSSESNGRGPSCAYPSWPRRTSLNGSVVEEASSSFISDDDLFPEVFDDNESDCTPIASPCRSPPQATVRETEIVSFTTIRQMLALEKARQPEKKRRTRRSSSSSSRKSRNGPAKQMSPILEAGE